MYVPFSNLSVGDTAAEEMEYTHVHALEGNGMDSETSDGAALAEEVHKYQNLWSSEDDPRAIPLPDPDMICPTHHIACKTGICEDMSKILRAKKREKMKAEWEEKNKDRGIRYFFFFCLFCFVYETCLNVRNSFFTREKKEGDIWERE